MKSQLDLNLLKVLTLLDQYRHLKPVAKSLGKTESAVSKQLAKLREQLGDPLFVRGAHEFEPTEYTLQLLPKISEGMQLIDTALTREAFDPKSHKKEIVIALPDIAQCMRGDQILIDLLATFPNAPIKLTSWHDLTSKHILEDRIDLGIHYFNEGQTKTIYQQPVSTYRGMIVTPASLSHLSLEEKLKLPFVLMEMKGWLSNKAVTKQALVAAGYDIKKIATVDSTSCLFKTIEQLGCATLFPYAHHLPDNVVGEELPESVQRNCKLSIVANYKLANRGNPLHQLLIKKLTHHLFEPHTQHDLEGA
ncbi:LysR family transcriptional regulator [Vibrio sp. NTOU-M3]|uniref:LysR family transcriptional regulator n=1 Tax=Vibrio sp. NTOU-M3 TaxID=3234954 RepID=UPI00349F3127